MAKSKKDNSKNDYNIVLSWSGTRSGAVAEAFREWLPTAVQAAKPWMSETDISKGDEWQGALGEQLEACRIGIVFLTPQNLESRWLHYEAGALSKTKRQGGKVSSILLDGLRASGVGQPLSIFQNTQPTESDLKKLILSLGQVIAPDVSKETLTATFKSTWPTIKAVFLPDTSQHVVAPKPSAEEKKLNELLELTQNIHRIVSGPAKFNLDAQAAPSGSGFYSGLTTSDGSYAGLFGKKL